MKAMILAAGLGTRMRPLTHLLAKPVLPVMNRPLLHWTLAHLRRAGVREVVINTHHLPKTVRDAVGNGGAFGLRVTYAHERVILGTGGGPKKVRDFFGDEPFVLVNGDMVFDFDLRRLVRRHRETGARATLALRRNPDPRRYGAVRTDGQGRVLSLAGLPRPTSGTPSLFTGIHVLDPALLDRLPRGVSDTVRDLYAPMIDAGERVMGVRMAGRWFDLGSPPLYLESHAALLRAGFGGARRGSLIHPRAKVHSRARVVRSAVGAGTVVEEGATVRDSVLWEGVRVGEGALVQGSVLATGTRAQKDEVVKGRVVVPKGRGGQASVEIPS